MGCEAPVQGTHPPAELLPGSSRLSDLLSDGGLAGYKKATEPPVFSFPDDHGPHPDFRNEWWYVTGNLDADDGSGERFGFELTFFRFSLTPGGTVTSESAWRTNQVYIAHFAITDVGADQFHVAQRYSRGGAGLAGATSDPFRVWVDDWKIDAASPNASWRLAAHEDDFGIDIQLKPLKRPVLNGNAGLSRKSDEPGNASFYYSISRLQSSGTVTIGDLTYAVTGLAWLDREWSSSALSKDQRGWDWFALQLSDGSDLMFYQLRQNDGSIDIHSAGTWIDPDGNAVHLGRDDVSIWVKDYWKNDRDDRYPAAWQIDIPSIGFSLDVTPVMADQELTTNVKYWEGAVDVSGQAAGARLAGRGYVELTGYAEH
ncbi:MAG: carotenoid 1,2-hydratase [Proteobacteria bacterium]|nr:carotenoid 1,2-hydratase [Pseudomonadota bacterium]